MKRFLTAVLLFTFVLCFMSCDTDGIKSYDDKIELDKLKISEDSVTLTWSVLNSPAFAGYAVVRKTEANEEIDFYYGYNVIKRIYDPTVTEYTDTDVPLTSYLEYQVVGLVTGVGMTNIFSNTRTYERPEYTPLEFNVYDILPDVVNANRLYIMEKEDGIISIFDYETMRTVNTITSNARIGFSDMGVYNSVRELYVPRADGWLFIYNAETLEQIDKINMGGAISSVVYNDGYLFASIIGRSDRSLEIYGRETKELVTKGNHRNDIRLRKIPNSKTELVGVSINYDYPEFYYYKFNHSERTLEWLWDGNNGRFPGNDFIFQFFPDGKKFITSKEGAIYDIDMKYQIKIPRGNLFFSDYAFSSDGSVIYCASSNSKSVVSYSYPELDVKKEYKTIGYPYRIFKKNNTLICVSVQNSEYTSSPKGIFIEKIEL